MLKLIHWWMYANPVFRWVVVIGAALTTGWLVS